MGARLAVDPACSVPPEFLMAPSPLEINKFFRSTKESNDNKMWELSLPQCVHTTL